MQTSIWLFVFPKEPIGLTCQNPLTMILYDPRTASANKHSSMGVMLSNISKAPVRVPGKGTEIIRQASLRIIMSFLTRYFLLRPPAQDTQAYDMIRRIIAVNIHFIIDGFFPHVLSTICLHCINAVVALRIIRVICGFQVSLLSGVTPNSLACKESSSFVPFIDKKPKSGFCLWVNSMISVFLLLNFSSCSKAQFAPYLLLSDLYLWSKAYQLQWPTLLDHRHRLKHSSPCCVTLATDCLRQSATEKGTEHHLVGSASLLPF